MHINIKSTGKALPNLHLHNDQIKKMVDTNSEWIISRTGIEARYICVEETALDIAYDASEKALIDIEKDEIGLVIVATVTPDMLVPSMGALVKKKLGLKNAIAFDINTACSGFIYATWVAESIMLRDQNIKKALVVGVERLSRILNWEDRNTCVLFGDGAGVAVLEKTENDSKGILGSVIKNYDDVNDVLTCGMDYIKSPFIDLPKSSMFLRMSGTKVFKFAVSAIDEVMGDLLEKTNLTADEIDYYVPHQANYRIITHAAKQLKQPLSKFQINIDKTGNTSAASVPMALDDLFRSGKVKKGDKIMLIGFGGGLSAGAILIEI